jgi:hypothetical protein
MSFGDDCYYLEAVSGDGGNHTSSVWWLSPDIILNGGTDQANQSGPNTVDVRIHVQPCATFATEVAYIDVYVGDPSLVMTPTGNTTKLTNDPNDLARPEVTVPHTPPIGPTLVTFTWLNGGTAVEAPGHKCLIAQIYPGFESPSTTTFDLPTEQHVAQRNITILMDNPNPDIQANTINPNPKGKELVTVRAVADLKPAKHVLQAARNALRTVPAFKRLRTTGVPPFAMEFKGLRDVRLTNNSEKPSAKGNYGRLKVPNCEARFELKPKQKTKFKFHVNLEEANYGDAFIFHLMHLDSKQRVIGGLTVIAVRTKKETPK